MTSLALIGNPNCGKTTIFNKLTGAKQKTGNWPGVTVERKTGKIEYKNKTIYVNDLPGLYSITTATDLKESALDEQITQDFVFHNKDQIYINIINAYNLERGLNLTLELKSLGLPCIVVLNMMDQVEKNNIQINLEKLTKILELPVIAISATKNLKQTDFIDKIFNSLEQLSKNTEFLIKDHTPSIEQRYEKIKNIIDKCVIEKSTQEIFDEKIDKILLNKYLGLPIFLTIIYLMFECSMTFGNALKPLFDIPTKAIFVDGLYLLATKAHFSSSIANILANGLGVGINTVAGFIPQLWLLFFFIAFLEDSGYMARAAFIMDRIMQTIGLQGQSFVPLIIGFGCNVPAIMATRHLNSARDRIITSLMTPFMSCGARLAIFVVFANAFFPQNPGIILFILYLSGIAAALITGFIVNKILLPTKSSFFVLEMPSYHLPQIKNIFILTWNRLKGFVLRAGRIILPICLLIGAFSTNGAIETVSRKITPILSPMGIKNDNWPATVGLMTGVMAKEVVIGSLNTLYSNNEKKVIDSEDNKTQFNLPDIIKNTITETKTAFASIFHLQSINPFKANQADSQMSSYATSNMMDKFSDKYAAFAYCLFVLLYTPCISTIGVLARESGKVWSIISTIWSIDIAYSIAVIFYQTASIINNPIDNLTPYIIITTLITINIFLLASLKSYIKSISNQSYSKILDLKNMAKLDFCDDGCKGCALKSAVQCN